MNLVIKLIILRQSTYGFSQIIIP